MAEKRCMIVGSGLMVPCLVSTLKSLGYAISIAGNIESELNSLSSTYGVQTYIADATSPGSLSALLDGISVVVSMVPAKFHHFVLKACIERKINLVTPSYVSAEMYELEQQTIDAGIVVINEVGLDPGIDHMSVMHKILQIRALGGKILDFQSSCGAFPAPLACTNLLNYKLAWAPYGALFAAVRPAKFLSDGNMVEIPPFELMNSALPYDLPSSIPLVYYPNGDSSKYTEKYEIQEAKTVVRCSLRYENYTFICAGLVKLGIYDESPREFAGTTTWKALTSQLVGAEVECVLSDEEVIEKVTQKLKGLPESSMSLVISALKELGLLSETIVKGRSIFDAYVNLVQKSLEYSPGEEDCVIMEHKYLVQYNDKQVRYRSLLVEHGVPNGGVSAISRLVSIPAALAMDWICNNSHSSGFMFPMEEKFCSDILQRLECDYNVKFQESEEIVN